MALSCHLEPVSQYRIVIIGSLFVIPVKTGIQKDGSEFLLEFTPGFPPARE
jgi:hypothetical protein